MEEWHDLFVASAGAAAALNAARIPGGYYWLVVSIIISFLKASLDAWVLLVEVNR